MSKLLFFALLLFPLLFPLPSQARDIGERQDFLEDLANEIISRPYHAPKGYNVDHIIPLCLGGADTKENMQLLTIKAHKKKTKKDLKDCREKKKKDNIKPK